MPDTGPDDDLARKLSWNGPGGDDARFLSVFMDQNNHCNLRCITCGFSDPRFTELPKYDFPRSLFDRAAAELFPRSTFVCLSLTTEPFLTRDFPDRLHALRDYGVPFSEIFTNGTMLNRAACEAVVAAEVSRVSVSIDGGTKSVFEAVRAGARFENVLANTALLHGIRVARGSKVPALRIHHVLSEANIETFDEFLELVLLLNADEIAVRTVSRMGNAKVQQSSDPLFWDQVRGAREKLAAFCARTGIADSGYLRDRHTPIDVRDESGESLVCRRPWTTLALHPNGDVYPCMGWARPPIGNLATQTFEELWNGAAMAGIRREFEAARPGVDCLHCTIRRDDVHDPEDDSLYRKLAKPAPR